MGTLTANGRVFVINRDGILFGPGAVINTAGFLATTNDIKNSDFMAGRYNFNIPGRPDASIVNQGRITATSGGFAALVAPGVRNSGTITATLGTVALAAGNSFTLDLYGDKLITLAVNDQIASKVIDVATGQPLKSLVTNDGKIRANGGRVELTAAAARARGRFRHQHQRRDQGQRDRPPQRHDRAQRRDRGEQARGRADPDRQDLRHAVGGGQAQGYQGRHHRGDRRGHQARQRAVDASGRAGGGKVLIGGDWRGGNPNTSLVNNASAKLESFAIPTATTVSVDPATTIKASATERGNGGKVVLWSDSQTTFAGTILARGGAQGGDGGFVETSSHGQLSFTRQRQCWRAARRGRHAAARSAGHRDQFGLQEAAECQRPDDSCDQRRDLDQDPNGTGNWKHRRSWGRHIAWNAGTTLTLNAYATSLFNRAHSVTNTARAISSCARTTRELEQGQ